MLFLFNGYSQSQQPSRGRCLFDYDGIHGQFDRDASVEHARERDNAHRAVKTADCLAFDGLQFQALAFADHTVDRLCQGAGIGKSFGLAIADEFLVGMARFHCSDIPPLA